MLQDKFKKYENDKKVIIPQNYIDMILSCDNEPEKICEDYGDVNLFSFEEFAEAQEYMDMSEFCPDYVAVGNTGGGQVLLMEQKKDSNSVIITGAGNLIPKYWDDTVCSYIDDFKSWAENGCRNIFECDEDEE